MRKDEGLEPNWCRTMGLPTIEKVALRGAENTQLSTIRPAPRIRPPTQEEPRTHLAWGEKVHATADGLSLWGAKRLQMSMNQSAPRVHPQIRRAQDSLGIGWQKRVTVDALSLRGARRSQLPRNQSAQRIRPSQRAPRMRLLWGGKV